MRDISDKSSELQVSVWRGQRLHTTSAYAIKVGDEWFAGFGMDKDKTPIVKLRRGLCDAKLIGGSAPKKVEEYVRRLADHGYIGRAFFLEIFE